MRLLDKANPTATRQSVISWAISGAIYALVMTFLSLRLASIPLLIAMAIVGAGIGAWSNGSTTTAQRKTRSRKAFPLRASGTENWTTNI